MGLFGHNGFLSKIAKGDKNAISTALAPVTSGASLLLNSDVIDSITGAKSAKEANERNIQLQKETNQQNIDLQHETNQTSIDLANSAHQREVADLKAAGLNPVLSAYGSGSATPTLGTASVQAPEVQNTMPGGYLAQAQALTNVVGGLAQAKNLVANSSLAKAQTEQVQTDTEYMPAMKKAEIAAQYANAGSAKAQADYTTMMKDIDADIKRAETNKVKAETFKNLKEFEGNTSTKVKIPGIFEHTSNKSANSGRTTGELYKLIKNM